MKIIQTNRYNCEDFSNILNYPMWLPLSIGFFWTFGHFAIELNFSYIIHPTDLDIWLLGRTNQKVNSWSDKSVQIAPDVKYTSSSFW